MASFSKALSPALREVRIFCCQSSPASVGTRQFILSSYPVIKQHNPDLPFMIREASGTPARAFARFERGVEEHVELEGLSESDVSAKVAKLVGVS